MSKEPVDIKRTCEYYLRRALDNEKKGELFDALKLYRKAFENSDASAEMFMHASLTASRLGFTSLAGRYITEAMLKGCPEPECLCAIGFSLCAQGRKRDAQRILDLLPLVRGGGAALHRLADFYGKCFGWRNAAQRHTERKEYRSRHGASNVSASEIIRPGIRVLRDKDVLYWLDRYSSNQTVYRALREAAAYLPDRMLLHAVSASALACGLSPDKVTEGWKKILDADPYDIAAGKFISGYRMYSDSVQIHLSGTMLPAEYEAGISREIDAISETVLHEKKETDPAEKRFIYSVCHGGMYLKYRQKIDRILELSTDDKLRKFRQILPLRIDLLVCGGKERLHIPANSYSMKYPFLRFSLMPGLDELALERLAWQRSFAAGICDYLRDIAGGFLEAELAETMRVFMRNKYLRNMCMFHTDTAQAAIVAMYCEKLQPNITPKTIMSDFNAPVRSVARAVKIAKDSGLRGE